MSITRTFSLFLLLNILFYLFIFILRSSFPFQRHNYIVETHHFMTDERINGGDTSFFRLLGAFDGQWYLYIAQNWYLKDPPPLVPLSDKSTMATSIYAFFPLYPLLIRIINIFFQDVELAAFFLTVILLIANFFSFYYIFSKLFNRNFAIKSLLLFFFFPFSIFLRMYYTESLFLLLLLWCSYWIVKKRLALAGILFGLLALTKSNASLISLLIIKRAIDKKTKLVRIALYSGLMALPIIAWFIYVYYQTGDFWYMLTTQKLWYVGGSLPPFLYNLFVIILFPQWPLHSFHLSQLDILMLLFFGFLLIKSRQFLSKDLWYIALFLWIFPLFVKDLQSYSRFQAMNFPLFIYMSHALPKKYYQIALLLSGIIFMLFGLYFVNWHWIG